MSRAGWLAVAVAGAYCALVYWLFGGGVAAAMAPVAGVLAFVFQSGAGVRGLVTGMRLDVEQLRKTGIEIDKLRADLERSALETERLRLEIRRMTGVVREPSEEVIVQFGLGRLREPGLIREQEKCFR